MEINFGAHAHHIGFFQTCQVEGLKRPIDSDRKSLSEKNMSARIDIAFTGDAVLDFFVATSYVEARLSPN